MTGSPRRKQTYLYAGNIFRFPTSPLYIIYIYSCRQSTLFSFSAAIARTTHDRAALSFGTTQTYGAALLFNQIKNIYKYCNCTFGLAYTCSYTVSVVQVVTQHAVSKHSFCSSNGADHNDEKRVNELYSVLELGQCAGDRRSFIFCFLRTNTILLYRNSGVGWYT